MKLNLLFVYNDNGSMQTLCITHVIYKLFAQTNCHYKLTIQKGCIYIVYMCLDCVFDIAAFILKLRLCAQ